MASTTLPPSRRSLLPPSSYSDPYPSNNVPPSRSIPIILPVFFLFILVLFFLSIFLFRDILQFTYAFVYGRLPGAGRRAAAAEAGRRGLDPAILASFPTLPYSVVRRLQEGKCGAECAVCLAEFAEGDVIRLLTVCCHAFHPPCIDSWLAAHATCPVCRSDLEAPPDEAAVMAVRDAVDGGGRDNHHSVSIEDWRLEKSGSTRSSDPIHVGETREEAAADGGRTR